MAPKSSATRAAQVLVMFLQFATIMASSVIHVRVHAAGKSAHHEYANETAIPHNTTFNSSALFNQTAGTTVSSLLRTSQGIDIAPSAAAVAAIALGALVCAAGYKLFKPAMFCCGFFLGGMFCAGAAEAAFQHAKMLVAASWIAFFVGGLLAGALVVWAYGVGVFCIGAAAGVFLASTLNTSVGHYIYPENPMIVLVVLAVILGIAGGVAAVKIERPVLIVGTSIFGAHVMVWGAGYFIGNYPSGADLSQYRVVDAAGHVTYAIPDAFWGYFLALIVLTGAGIMIQFHKTSKGYSHQR